MPGRQVFITGATGYMGRGLIPLLLARGHSVRALARAGSEHKLPGGSQAVTGDALNQTTFSAQIAPCDTFVHLIGVPHPSPAKAEQFKRVDLVSIREAAAAAVRAQIRHFVYVSVAQPAPLMEAYIRVRAEGEVLIQKAGLNATILRPWYVLGPGHWWPRLLLPGYWALETFPSTRETARRLGLVKLDQMLRTLLYAVEHPCFGIRLLTVADIRRGGIPD
ncbi:MAG: NAD(P)H-binding protein [Acidobacteria bacterium]|nr:NAD(P)H-binding protein [Acidobacteriota bacterium]